MLVHSKKVIFIIYASVIFTILFFSKLNGEENKIETENSEKKEVSDPWNLDKSQITVTGTRRKKLLKDSIVKTEVITRKDIESMGARTVADTLGNVPGIEVRPAEAGQRGESVRLQGLSAQNVLILIDGQRVTGRFNGSIDLTRFKVEDIERIEIVKGASSSLYGSDAIAGVINIIMREATEDYQADFRSLYGTGRKLFYGSGGEFRNSGSVGIREDFYSTQFTAGWHRGNGYDLTPDASPGSKNNRFQSQKDGYDPTPENMSDLNKLILLRTNTRYQPPLENTTSNKFQDLNVSNRSVFHLTDNTDLLLNGVYRYLDQEGVDSSEPRRVFDRRNQTHDFMGAVGLESAINEKTHLSLNTNYSRFEDRFTLDQRNSDELNKNEGLLNNVYEFRSRLDLSQIENHTFSLGAEALAENIRSPRIEADCLKNFPNFCPNTLFDLPPAEDSGSAARQRNAVFIQDEWKVSDKKNFSVIPGIRYENDSQFGNQTMPKLSARWDATKEYIFRASAGLGYRAPNFVELYYDFQNPGVGYRVTGNPDLKPEISRSYNLGGEWEPNKKFWFSWNLFYNNIDNLIGTRLQPNRDTAGLQIYQTTNFEKVETNGIETSLNYKLSNRFTASLGYTFTNSRNRLTNLPIESVVRNRINGSIRYYNENNKFGFSIFMIAFGKQPIYCELDGLHCKPEVGSVNSQIYAAISNPEELNQWRSNIPLPLQKYCTANNIGFCNDEPVYGHRMVNSFTNINLRVFKKIGNHLELFAGIDNLLEEYDLIYNPQRPRFFYFGVSGSFVASKQEESIAHSNN
ncbi:TonB-dependent receptor plug domain-containing protein [Leptospira sp. GIMC2001]|uniref:TonB-dependent receptor plug domain-containing protein n=1 Tax=Leptospira sp. GIMC2001 TaxID=1513297 RepID=UPI00234ACFF6|nr:TonB-dependent receptor [Leptospira sp. GIMC2001]WCL49119.1 TonB-dependent receptor [Leptospira sp. GIMC2001]